jgi:hypothetical protein
MTVVSFISIKGAPGVTTLACLVGATWPEERKVMVAECDPSGGDLAGRFQLSAREGWPSLVAAARRTGSEVSIASHLQKLPGGLDVLVAARATDATEAAASMSTLLTGTLSSPDGPWDVLLDLGRLAPGDRASAAWLEHSDAVLVCVRSDAASVLHVRDRSTLLLDQYPGRVGLAVVEGGGHSSPEIERFTGIPVIGVVPFDPLSAAVAAGERRSERRLRRSMLVTSASRISSVLASKVQVDQGSHDVRQPRIYPAVDPPSPYPRPEEALR